MIGQFFIIHIVGKNLRTMINYRIRKTILNEGRNHIYVLNLVRALRIII